MATSSFRRGSLPMLLVLLAALATAWPSVAETAFAGHWEGQITLPNGALEIDIDLVGANAGALRGDITIPAQNVRDMALGDIRVDGEAVSFNIPGIPGDPIFDGSLSADASVLSGTFTQSGTSLEFSLERSADPADTTAAALEGFEDVARQAVKDFNVPGFAVAVVRGDRVVYAEGFGYRDVEQKLPMTADSLFAIGSTTKAMTATLLAMQVEEGSLDWDEPLVRYLPSFRLADPMITARVTPRDLVSHRSGLPRHDLLWYNAGGGEGRRAALIERFEHLELTADLRERFQYNNLMFMTAGYLAGQIDGGTWEQSMRRRLFAPLGMERSGFSVRDSKRDPDHALPYRENEEDQLERIPFRNIDLIGPAGSVNSSVREMARWLRFNLAGGRLDDRQLMQSASLEDLHLPHMSTGAAPVADSRVSQSAYGMGWGVEVYRGHRRVGHGGGIDGFRTVVELFPDDDLGIVAFVNRGSGLAGLITQVVADRLLGLEEVDWLGEALKRLESGQAAVEEAEKKTEGERVSGTEPSHALSDFVGTYADPGYGAVEVTLEGSRLSFVMNSIVTPLEHWHYNVFRGAEEAVDPTFEGTRLQFRSDLDGQVNELVVPLELTASPVVFSKQPSARLSDPEYLQRFVGTYHSPLGQDARVELAGDRLTVHLPGQPTYTLVPTVSGRFAIEGLQGFNVGFELDGDGKVLKGIFYQPNGVFDFERVAD